MAFKIGDKVRMIIERHARAHGVWEKVGEVVEIVETGTPPQKITVKFPDAEPVVGMDAGQFKEVI